MTNINVQYADNLLKPVTTEFPVIVQQYGDEVFPRYNLKDSAERLKAEEMIGQQVEKFANKLDAHNAKQQGMVTELAVLLAKYGECYREQIRSKIEAGSNELADKWRNPDKRKAALDFYAELVKFGRDHMRLVTQQGKDKVATTGKGPDVQRAVEANATVNTMINNAAKQSMLVCYSSMNIGVHWFLRKNLQNFVYVSPEEYAKMPKKTQATLIRRLGAPHNVVYPKITMDDQVTDNQFTKIYALRQGEISDLYKLEFENWQRNEKGEIVLPEGYSNGKEKTKKGQGKKKKASEPAASDAVSLMDQFEKFSRELVQVKPQMFKANHKVMENVFRDAAALIEYVSADNLTEATYTALYDLYLALDEHLSAEGDWTGIAAKDKFAEPIYDEETEQSPIEEAIEAGQMLYGEQATKLVKGEEATETEEAIEEATEENQS